jgi:hypothetical protein
MVKNVHANNELCLVKNLSETACWLVNTKLVKQTKHGTCPKKIQGVPKNFHVY